MHALAVALLWLDCGCTVQLHVKGGACHYKTIESTVWYGTSIVVDTCNFLDCYHHHYMT